MGEWKEVTIDQIKANSPNALATGPFGSAISSKFFTDNGVPVIRGGNLSADISNRLSETGLVFISPSKAEEFKRSEVKKGDLVFTCWGTINQVGLIDGKGSYQVYIISNKQMKLTPHPKKADPFFLYYFFSSPQMQEQILSSNIGSSVPGFNLGQLKAIELNLPPLPEQKGIASVLSSLDDKIDLLHRQNKTLEAMAETFFRQWFVEEAQVDWKNVLLGEFFPVVTGKKNANYSNEDGQYPFFTCSQGILKAPGYSFEGKAILLAGNGDFNVKRCDGKFEAYQRTYVLIPFKKKYFNFLFVLIKYFLAEITGGHQGSVINFITKGMITDFRFQIPINDSQNELTIFDRIYDKVDFNYAQIYTLEKLRDTLLPKLMSGEVRVVYEN